MSGPLLDREVRRRLAVLRHAEEASGTVALMRRYEADGVDRLRDRSKRPWNSPNATRAVVADQIIHTRCVAASRSVQHPEPPCSLATWLMPTFFDIQAIKV